MNREIRRILNNMSKVPLFNTTVSVELIDRLFDCHADIIFCNGKLRKISVDKITDKTFRIYTKPC